MAELADAQASGACGSNIVRVQIPFPASSKRGSVGTGRRARLRILWLLQSCGFKSHLPHWTTLKTLIIRIWEFFVFEREKCYGYWKAPTRTLWQTTAGGSFHYHGWCSGWGTIYIGTIPDHVCTKVSEWRLRLELVWSSAKWRQGPRAWSYMGQYCKVDGRYF